MKPVTRIPYIIDSTGIFSSPICGFLSPRAGRAIRALFLAGMPCLASAQFVDTFDTLNPAWVTNRYAPAGFNAVSYLGDNRLGLTIDESGSTANRPAAFSSSFYNTQGMHRPGGITGLWSISAQVYVASSFNTTSGVLASSDLWGHTGTTPGGGAYLIFGFTNESPTDTLNPAPAADDRSFRFQVFDVSTGNFVNVGVPVNFMFDAWHTLSGVSTGLAFEYYIDGAFVFAQPTTHGYDLLSAMVQGYNFGQSGAGYTVYWDNLTVSAVPEPAAYAVLLSLGALLAAVKRKYRRRRMLTAPGADV